MFSPYFILVFGVQILFLALNATFWKKPELMRKNYLRDHASLNRLKKAASCTQGKTVMKYSCTQPHEVDICVPVVDRHGM